MEQDFEVRSDNPKEMTQSSLSQEHNQKANGAQENGHLHSDRVLLLDDRESQQQGERNSLMENRERSNNREEGARYERSSHDRNGSSYSLHRDREYYRGESRSDDRKYSSSGNGNRSRYYEDRYSRSNKRYLSPSPLPHSPFQKTERFQKPNAKNHRKRSSSSTSSYGYYSPRRGNTSQPPSPHSYDHPPSHRLFVHYHHTGGMTRRFLLDTFSYYGTITGLQVPVDRYTHLAKPFGFVEFKHQSDAERAVIRLHKTKWTNYGRLTVRFASQDRSRLPPLWEDEHWGRNDRGRSERDMECEYECENEYKGREGSRDRGETRGSEDGEAKESVETDVVAMSQHEMFMTASVDSIIQDKEEFLPFIDYLVRLRDTIKTQHADETPEKQVRRMVELQLSSLEEHLVTIQQLKTYFPTIESLGCAITTTSPFASSTSTSSTINSQPRPNRARKSLLLTSLTQTSEILEHMIIQAKPYPTLFPRLPSVLFGVYRELRELRGVINVCFETEFSRGGLMDWEKVWGFAFAGGGEEGKIGIEGLERGLGEVRGVWGVKNGGA
ncbi:hypothetical protein G7Y89_g8325 [Cudoniella acicularis]|uniref:RRM domain-containing protein n=1 Tax=Cudoniella acicularis TaxID=354080 RepID=A0A8H4W162_9HELO|nr:hypothetical protein G7Y89_g8325 [Cudoniella acicularis]